MRWVKSARPPLSRSWPRSRLDWSALAGYWCWFYDRCGKRLACNSSAMSAPASPELCLPAQQPFGYNVLDPAIPGQQRITRRGDGQRAP